MTWSLDHNNYEKSFMGVAVFLPTLLSLLRIPIFCHFGSTSFVLPIRPKNSILNRDRRVQWKNNWCIINQALRLFVPKKSWVSHRLFKSMFDFSLLVMTDLPPMVPTLLLYIDMLTTYFSNLLPGPLDILDA